MSEPTPATDRRPRRDRPGHGQHPAGAADRRRGQPRAGRVARLPARRRAGGDLDLRQRLRRRPARDADGSRLDAWPSSSWASSSSSTDTSRASRPSPAAARSASGRSTCASSRATAAAPRSARCSCATWCALLDTLVGVLVHAARPAARGGWATGWPARWSCTRARRSGEIVVGAHPGGLGRARGRASSRASCGARDGMDPDRAQRAGASDLLSCIERDDPSLLAATARRDRPRGAAAPRGRRS